MALSIEKQKLIIAYMRQQPDWVDSADLADALGESKYKVRTWLAAMLAECTIEGWILVSRQDTRPNSKLAQYKVVRDPAILYRFFLKTPIPMTVCCDEIENYFTSKIN